MVYGHLMEVMHVHLEEIQILLEYYALLLKNKILTTFFEVDCWKYTRLHQYYLFTFVCCWDCLITHLSAYIYLTLRQLYNILFTISIYLIMSNYLYLSRFVGDTPAFTLPLRRVPTPSPDVFYCLYYMLCT